MDTQTTGVYLTLVTGLAFVTLLLVLFIVSFLRHQHHKMEEYKKQVFREIELIDRERERIAADLHDELGTGLSAIGLLLRQSGDASNDPLLKKANQQLEKQVRKMKEIAHGLIPFILESHGLVVALTNLIEEIKMAGNIHVSASLFINDANYQPAKSVHVYRIIREILTNTIKHAGATAIYISAEQDEKKILLTIRDNGSGFDISQLQDSSPGQGLQNIHTRIELLGASLSLNAVKGSGTAYLIKIPLISMLTTHGK